MSVKDTKGYQIAVIVANLLTTAVAIWGIVELVRFNLRH